jgi:two-component system phosphate regulon response regulator OmpR
MTVDPQDADRHVMVVDDEPHVRAEIRSVFEAEGWKVTEASGGVQALGLLREPPLPDVVLLDLVMPGLDGYAVLTELKEREPVERVPVVVLSARPGPLSSRVAQSLGADDCIAKPVDPDVLRTRCAALADRGHDGGEPA